MKENAFIRRYFAPIVITVLGIAGCVYSAMFLITPASEAQSGAGRLLITSFPATIYAVNADPSAGTQSFTMVDNYAGGYGTHPSVADNGTIAFSYKNPGDDDYRVWAMDADGSNRRKLTFNWTAPATDAYPIISPDGTKVAFISNRTTNDPSRQLFIVNTDGTNLHQITPTDVEGCGSNCFAYVEQFDWSGNSNVIVAGAQFYTDPNTNQRVLRYGLFNRDINSIGDAPPPIKITGNTGYANAECLDVAGGKILYGNGNRLFLFDFAGNQIGQVNGTHFNEQLLGPGGARLSPDASRIVYSSGDDNGSLVTMNLDGTGRVTVQNSIGIGVHAIWWSPQGTVPVPARLELGPRVFNIPNDGSPFTMTPSLYDASDNLIFHSAYYSVICDAGHPCNVPFNPYGGFQLKAFDKINLSNASTTNTGYATVCASNAGLSGCSLIALNRDVDFAEINASVASVNTNGSGGPGVFTIRRVSSQANSSFSVDFTLGGTAVRDVDYVLNIPGNSVLIPPGRNTVDITVTPLAAAGNKTVTMSITAGGGSSYLTVSETDHDTMNIVDNGSPVGPLSLSTIAPSRGGNGGVVVSTIYGSNIGSGATVKLTRAGQSDIPGANTNVVATGKSLTTVFDLRGRAAGQWNVVVTNPNNSSQQISNGFQIEPNTPNRLTAQISGASEIRASHTRSRYDVVYTNHGNTDVFGVVVFITGVTANECADVNDANCTYLDTPLQDIPDIPGQSPFPAWVRQVPHIVPVDLPNVSGPGTRHVGAIPVLIPRIPANSSATFRFSMRFTVIGESALQKINAAILPPLVEAVTIPGAPRPTIAMRPNSTEDANADMNCLDSIFLNAINCAVGFIPGNACLGAGLGAIQNVAQLAASTSVQGDAAITPMSGAQLYAAGLSVMTCLKSASPIGTLLNVIGCLAGVYDSCVTCLGPDACNPFNLFFVQSADPNEKKGVRRLTPQNFIPTSNLMYGISFENKPDASAPAQDVVITDQLDTSKLDTATFELGQISFGDTVINVPAGLTNYTTEVDLRPANDVLVSVNAHLDQNTGLITWTFNSLDPFTRQSPTNALAGFLPPDVDGVQGAGKVLFTISPKNTVITGDEIRNHATIVFDLSAPIDTNEWLNTIDDSKPVSGVQPLAAQQSSATFAVNWSGTDTGSGINDYTLYVSENSGPFNPAVVGTTNTSTQFTGQYDTTYSFYTIARDNAGNIEGAKSVGEATTHTSAAPNFTIGGTVTYGNAVSGPAPPRYVSHVLISGAGSPNVSIFTAAPGAGAGTYSLGGFGSGSYTVTPTKTGGAGTSISSFDAAKIAQHVAGVSVLTGNQLVVADVSNNGNISSFDAGEIANYVVAGSPIGSSGTWRFSPVTRTYASITANVTGEDYSALLMGEVSGNWTNTGARPVGRQPADGRSMRSISVSAPDLVAIPGGEVVIPVAVQGAANKEIISYEFDLRYDPTVLQPEADAVNLAATVSDGLSFAVNAGNPGILKVAVYGALPIDRDGVLLNLRFTAVGAPGSTSRLGWTHLIFNEGEAATTVSDGEISIWNTAANETN